MALPSAGSTLELGVGGLPFVQIMGLNTLHASNLAGFLVDTSGNVTAPGTLAVTGAQTFTGAATFTAAIVPSGGVAAAGGFTVPTAFSTGQLPVNATTGLTQKQIVTTETYYAEVFIPANTTITGISILNGHTTNASVSLFVGLANSSGTIVASSNTTTAQATADAYQQIAFTTAYAAKGPAKYYVCIQGSTTTGYLSMSALGNYGASKVTSETYGTFLTTASYATTTFTTGVGPVASTY